MSTHEPDIPYGGTTGERLKAFALSADARERAGALATQYWFAASYVVLLISAAVLRFYNLGARAMHHDESLHAYYGYGFSKGLMEFFSFGAANPEASGPAVGYQHVPFMHGAFQFIGGGTMMFIFGDGEYQSRLLAAVLGTAMVFMPFLLRKQIGNFGALAVSAFIAFSPTLVYFSRFTREDIYTAFWTLGIVIFMWRYIATKQDRFLFLTAGFLAGSFSTKETTYFTAAAFLIFLDYMFAVTLAQRIRARLKQTPTEHVVTIIGLLFVAWAVAVAWPFLETWREKYLDDELPAEGNLLVVMGALSLPMYAAGLQLIPQIGDYGFSDVWRNRAGEAGNLHVAAEERQAAYTIVIGLIGISAVIGLTWNPTKFVMAAASFWVPYVLLFSTFFTNMPGVMSGIWGSMDYWISQQDVRRGNQPDYYYFITIPVYEFLPLILSIAAGLYYAVRGRLRNALIIAAGLLLILFCLTLPSQPDIGKISMWHIWVPFIIVLAGVLAFPMDALTRFLLFWLVASGLFFTFAGEKMPWLNVHLALPLTVLAGRFVGDLLEGSDLRLDLPKLERLAPFAYAAVAAALSALVFLLVGPFTLASVGAWVLALVAGAATLWAFQSYSERTAAQVALVAFVAALLMFSVRAGVLASWGHRDGIPAAQAAYTTISDTDYGDVPIELLVYTQTSQDIPQLKKLVDKHAQETGAGSGLPIVVDSTDGFTWPWAWYLRKYRSVQWVSLSTTPQIPPGAIVFAARQNAANVQLQGQYEQGIEYHHRRWFPEDYRGAGGTYTIGDFFDGLFSKSELGDWLDYWVRRTPPSRLGTVDGIAFFPKGAAALPTRPVGPTVRSEGNQLVIGGPGSAPGQLNAPSDVALDAEGNIYVADTNNNRISKYTSSGQWVASVGGFAAATAFNQPWSMAVAQDGTVFVANTWGHTIVKLDKDLKQVKTWGSGGAVEAGGDPFKLFGPREIVVTPDGNVLVVDTGNNRVIEYTADGDVVRQVGRKGQSGDPLDLQEPVGLTATPDGDLLLADFWNKRILRYDADFGFKSQFDVPAWGSRNVTDRPYIAALSDGRIVVTDPEHHKILAFAADGRPLGEYEVPKPADGFARPVGITTNARQIIVVDAASSVVRVIDVAEVVK